MAVDTTGPGWTAKAEAALLELRDVAGVNIQADGDVVREIHVESTSTRPPKQIVRDVQTILRTRFNRSIDHRVVSVAYTQPRTSERLAAEVRPHVPPRVEPPRPVAVSPQDQATARLPAVDDRVRFESVNLYVAGPRVQAQVELRWKGVTRMGSAAGASTRDTAHQLVAAATVAAVQELLEDEVGLGVTDVRRIRVGDRDVMVVGVTLIAHRSEKVLVGSCTVEQDAQQAVALAVLAAVNRVLGGLRTKEPTEYVLRPASAQEASGAKHD